MKGKTPKVWFCALCGHPKRGKVCADCRLTRAASAELDARVAAAKAKGVA